MKEYKLLVKDEALEAVEKFLCGLAHDCNPHNDLVRGDSADYDACCDMLEIVRSALNISA